MSYEIGPDGVLRYGDHIVHIHCDSDPIECGVEARWGQVEEAVRILEDGNTPIVTRARHALELLRTVVPQSDVAPPAEEAVWVYGFQLHGPITLSWGLHELLRSLSRVEVEMTEAQWARFSADMGQLGLELHEVERWPYHLPQSMP